MSILKLSHLNIQWGKIREYSPNSFWQQKLVKTVVVIFGSNFKKSLIAFLNSSFDFYEIDCCKEWKSSEFWLWIVTVVCKIVQKISFYKVKCLRAGKRKGGLPLPPALQYYQFLWYRELVIWISLHWPQNAKTLNLEVFNLIS